MTNKRYILFAGYDYYPQGGWNDFICFFDSVESCENVIKDDEDLGYKYNWIHLVDLESGEVVLFWHEKYIYLP